MNYKNQEIEQHLALKEIWKQIPLTKNSVHIELFIEQNNPFDVTMKFTFAVKSSQYLYLEIY